MKTQVISYCVTHFMAFFLFNFILFYVFRVDLSITVRVKIESENQGQSYLLTGSINKNTLGASL
jgi:hypothetical protein